MGCSWGSTTKTVSTLTVFVVCTSWNMWSAAFWSKRTRSACVLSSCSLLAQKKNQLKLCYNDPDALVTRRSFVPLWLSFLKRVRNTFLSVRAPNVCFRFCAPNTVIPLWTEATATFASWNRRGCAPENSVIAKYRYYLWQVQCDWINKTVTNRVCPVARARAPHITLIETSGTRGMWDAVRISTSRRRNATIEGKSLSSRKNKRRARSVISPVDGRYLGQCVEPLP